MKEEKIIIYGAGNYGQKLYQFLEKKGVKIDFFCETHVNNEVICGIPVISRRQLIEINEKVIVLIGIADKTISSNISKYLKKYGGHEMAVGLSLDKKDFEDLIDIVASGQVDLLSMVSRMMHHCHHYFFFLYLMFWKGI